MRHSKILLTLSFAALGACGTHAETSRTRATFADDPYGKWAIDSTSDIHGDKLINSDGTGADRNIVFGQVAESSPFTFALDATTTPKRFVETFRTSGRKVYCVFQRQTETTMLLKCAENAYPSDLSGATTWHTY